MTTEPNDTPTVDPADVAEMVAWWKGLTSPAEAPDNAVPEFDTVEGFIHI